MLAVVVVAAAAVPVAVATMASPPPVVGVAMLARHWPAHPSSSQIAT